MVVAREVEPKLMLAQAGACQLSSTRARVQKRAEKRVTPAIPPASGGAVKRGRRDRSHVALGPRTPAGSERVIDGVLA